MPYFADSIAAWPAIHAARRPQLAAVSDSRRTLTYAELHRSVETLAVGLTEVGVTAGSRVAILMKNRVEFLELLFACARIGAIFTPVNYRLAPAEIGFILRDSQPDLLVVEEHLSPVAVEAQRISKIECTLWVAPNDLDRLKPVKEYKGDQDYDLAQPVMMLYTSGTTGSPKGVILTHENLIWNALNVIGDWGLTRDDVTLVVNPMFHSVVNIMATPLLYLGGEVILMEEFDPTAALAHLESGRISSMFAVATAWQMIAALPEFRPSSLAKLRLGASGGMAAPLSLLETFARARISFVQAYGLTETAPCATTMLVDDSMTKIGSIGRGFMNVEVKVANEEGLPVASGEQGEIWIRGRNVSPGYWNRERETEQHFLPDLWFRTGDIATWDDEGYIFIVDRAKDLIISGGENISSVEVEQALYQHPAVAQVAVVAAPSQRWGETPRAVVVLKEGNTATAEELMDHCRQLIARYKCPTIIDFTDDLPRTATGKIQKTVLRDGWRT